MSRFFKSAAFPILVVIVLAFFAERMISSSSSNKTTHTWSEFAQYVEQGKVTYVKTNQGENSLKYSTEPDHSHAITIGIPSPTLLDEVTSQLKTTDPNAPIDGTPTGGSSWWSIFTYILPFVLFFGLWIFLMNQVQGGGSKVMSFGKSRAKRMSVDSPKITFKDVAGVDEAVEELHEIKEFLENPKKFQALGARIPKGVLLFGPPAPARRCWRGRWPARPACPSSRSRDLTSSRCSSASARAASATCSSRPSRTRPASSSWTRSTPSAAIAAPAWGRSRRA